MNSGALWREQRRFAVSTLRDLGMGKSWLEDSIIAEVEELCEKLKNYKGKPVNPKSMLGHAVANVIGAMVFGKRFEENDKTFNNAVAMITENIQIVGRDAQLLQTFPFFKYIPGPLKNRFHIMVRNFRDLAGFITVMIKQHREQLTKSQKGDYIDAYFKKRSEQEEKGKTNTTFTGTSRLERVPENWI